LPDEVVTELRDEVAWIFLNRPDRLNAMNEALMDGLVEHLADAARNPAVRCVVLSGRGTSFCAGGDVAIMTDRHRGAPGEQDIGPRIDSQVNDLDRRFASIDLLVGMAKPTVAMMRGWALGGGLCLALACDLRIAAADARLGVGFLQRAISGNFGISFLLANVVGPARAKELAFLHDTVTADEALAIGLVTMVQPSGELEEHTVQVARRLASGPTFAFGKFKDSLNFATGAELRRIMHYEAVNSRMTSLSGDARESAAAFREKREPRFRGN
jgi:2-(1,2-epoxy-1,2-dihydrophenyl)acetyl-CoA isomerase